MRSASVARRDLNVSGPSSENVSPPMMAAALAVIAVCGWVIRAAPLLRAGGAFAYPIDYDEGVYFSASALLFKGVLPYRDFVFVHPPGLLYVLGFTSSLVGRIDAASAFAAARFLATLVGAINIFLVGRIALRWAGPFAGLVAAALYAGYPEVVTVERGPFLEPVLNLSCLAIALVWLSTNSENGGWRRPLCAGALCGVALAVKVWGGIWLLAALASLPAGRRWGEGIRFIGAAAVMGGALVFPLAITAPSNFLTDVLLFHAWRPPDGDVGRLSRLPTIIGGAHLFASVLALIGIVFGMKERAERSTRELRFFSGAYLLSIAAFLASSAYWSQYNSHLAASEVVLAGFGASSFLSWARSKFPRLVRMPALALPIMTLVVAFPSARRAVLGGRARAPEQVALGEAIRRFVPRGECLFAFEPAWGIAGGHLPPQMSSVPMLVDPYGAMLLGAVGAGSRFGDANAAFQDAGSQTQARALLESCHFVVLGWRGAWQLSDDTEAWFRGHFVKRHPVEGTDGIDLWERIN